MCFTIHPRHKEAKIAKKDIKCYKVFVKKGKLFESYFQDFLYEPGECYYESKLKPIKRGYFVNGHQPVIIEEGLHSFSNLMAVHRRTFWSKRIVVECTLPEGAKYYYNPDNKEYVSNYLIIGKKPMK